MLLSNHKHKTITIHNNMDYGPTFRTTTISDPYIILGIIVTGNSNDCPSTDTINCCARYKTTCAYYHILQQNKCK